MNKKQRIKKKTWEYFLAQKKDEICGFFKFIYEWIFPCLIAAILCASMLFSLVCFIAFLTNDFGKLENYKLLLQINFFINIIGWPCFGIYKWLGSNWKKAKNKAEKEVRK